MFLTGKMKHIVSQEPNDLRFQGNIQVSPRNYRFFICSLIAAHSAPAFAYLDPGTGSLLIQGIIASIAAAAAVGRLYWHRLVGFFRGKKRPEETEGAESAEDGSN